MTLGCSRKCVRLLAFRSSARVWAEPHEKAFRRLGGSPRVVVLDNLREGVLSPDFYDPGVNPLYGDVLAHYSVTALPCKVRDPDRKRKVESGVNHAQRTPLKGKKLREPTLQIGTEQTPNLEALAQALRNQDVLHD
jgi:transposase